MISREIIFYDEIASTNDTLKTLANNGAKDGTVVMAGTQTVGRGRLGRSWESKRGCGVYMSVLLRQTHKIKKPAQLSLVTGLAVSKTVEFFIPGEIKIKWPNDVLCNGRKLSGILVESVFNAADFSYFIVGIGINVNDEGFLNDLEYKATSFFMETGKMFKLTEIAKKLIDELDTLYCRFTERNADYIGEYRKRCININRQIRIVNADSEITGEAVGISDEGELIVRTQAGDILNVNSGEVSVRGIYGYV